jgi:hypothetical protein
MWICIACILLQIVTRLCSCESQEDPARHLKADREHDGLDYVDRRGQIIPGVLLEEQQHNCMPP